MALNRRYLPNRKLRSCGWILVRVIVLTLMSGITSSSFAQQITQRVVIIDSNNYQLPASVVDSGQMRFSRVLDRYRFAVNFTSLYAGRIPPKSGIGKHTHQYTEELYVILNGEAEFTVNGRTSRLKAPVIVPCTKEDTLAIYNPGDTPLHWFSFAV